MDNVVSAVSLVRHLHGSCGSQSAAARSRDTWGNTPPRPERQGHHRDKLESTTWFRNPKHVIFKKWRLLCTGVRATNLEAAVVPLVEAPCSVDGDPHEVRLLQDSPQCLDRSLRMEIRGRDDHRPKGAWQGQRDTRRIAVELGGRYGGHRVSGTKHRQQGGNQTQAASITDAPFTRTAIRPREI